MDNAIDSDAESRGAREPSGRKLFTFAVVADTHVNEHEERSASPFETNARANGRARYAMADIAALDPAPEFVVHLGDIVHPMPGLPVFSEAARRFKEIAAPLHLVPGNHDVGDKAVDWMPADIVCSDYVVNYRATFGPDYYAFDCGLLRGIEENDALFERLRFNDVKCFGLDAGRIVMTYVVEGKYRDGEPFSLRGIELVTVRDGRVAKKDVFWKQSRSRESTE